MSVSACIIWISASPSGATDVPLELIGFRVGCKIRQSETVCSIKLGFGIDLVVVGPINRSHLEFPLRFYNLEGFFSDINGWV